MPVRHPMSRGELDTDLTIKGAWTFNADQAFLGDVAITGALTAASYGGIVEGNLLDKTATETVSGLYDFTGGITRSSNFLLEGYSTGRSVVRATYLRIFPGATPGTNINAESASTGSRGYNSPAISAATNLAKSGSSGSFSLNAGGTVITLDLTEDIVGSLGSTITVHNINSSSTTEMYTVLGLISSASMDLFILKRGSSSAVDWTTIMDAGDQIDFTISFVAST